MAAITKMILTEKDVILAKKSYYALPVTLAGGGGEGGQTVICVEK